MTKNKKSIIIAIFLLVVIVVVFAIINSNKNGTKIIDESKNEIVSEIKEENDIVKMLDNFIYINNKYYYISDKIDLTSTSHLLGDVVTTIKNVTNGRFEKDNDLSKIENDTASYLPQDTTIHEIIGLNDDNIVGCKVGEEYILYVAKDYEFGNIITEMLSTQFSLEDLQNFVTNKENLNSTILKDNFNIKFSDNKLKHIFVSIFDNYHAFIIVCNESNTIPVEMYLRNIETGKVINIFTEDFITDINESIMISGSTIFTITNIENNKIFVSTKIAESGLDTNKVYNFEYNTVFNNLGLKIGNKITANFEIKNIENDQINLYNIKLDENIELENIE